MNERSTWYQAVTACEDAGQPYALVTILGTAGSVPREPGSKMVVTADCTYDTIGGGRLEHEIVRRSRQGLLEQDYGCHLCHFPLSASLGQCCGGSVSVLLECLPGGEGRLVVFGAGHVAHALMSIFGQLPWRVTWIDTRSECFPSSLPDNIRARRVDDPTSSDLIGLCDDSDVLIMTHSHQLDFDLCRGLLTRAKAASIGLIGSAHKAQRFRQRLAQRGFGPEAVDRIRCPIGRTDIPGKRPMEVAVAVSAELLGSTAQARPSLASQRGVPWRALKGLSASSRALNQPNPDEE